MKTFKSILKSLISNNACIDGGRKRPWYFAVIMLVLSMVFAILPLFVQTWKTNGDDAFKSYAYGTDRALVSVSEQLETRGYTITVVESASGEKVFRAQEGDALIESFNLEHKTLVQEEKGVDPVEVVDFNFYWRSTANADEFSELAGDGKTSFVYMTESQMYLHVVNFETKGTIKDLNCRNAAKEFETGYKVNDLLSKEADPTAKLNETWGNWKAFIKDAYNYTRLTACWQTCLIMSGINLAIVLFMGFMIWILSRGKQNPYRMFNLWDTQKMAWWTALTPGILALAVGFLMPNFANIIFPMLVGVRVMWLSMKSLRPDGTGYAAE